ncbi:MAG: septal ring lytic transglycosylase RlpA family protein [Vicinamibacteria bacterium]
MPPLRRHGSIARRVGALLVALTVSACASNPKPQGRGIANRPVPRIGTTATGIASWYGPGYDGKRTACGDRFDQDALTAAHGTWPCGTRVKVTLLSTGKSAVVEINDLFPNHKGRLIDVSKGTAKKIGLIGPGTGKVRVEVVSR